MICISNAATVVVNSLKIISKRQWVMQKGNAIYCDGEGNKQQANILYYVSILSPLGAKLGFLAGRVGLIQFSVGSGRVGSG